MKAKHHYITVKLELGMFESERFVSFDADGEYYHLIVDLGDLDGDRMGVDVIGRESGTYTVRLPRETFTTGATLKLPESIVHSVLPVILSGSPAFVVPNIDALRSHIAKWQGLMANPNTITVVYDRENDYYAILNDESKIVQIVRVQEPAQTEQV
jgi:hypothetical protein